ncbi:hypothetical protein TRAPUB_13902 [Trametes pubescens]|uniref:Uncharacterized protein n=1 Tax=Trametes pubescens TaxID=154538 RepID=A0A1M2VPW8_TRAPU|nr:hypothetical protein TRAPUB_13902 [Trametes pubescens]
MGMGSGDSTDDAGDDGEETAGNDGGDGEQENERQVRVVRRPLRTQTALVGASLMSFNPLFAAGCSFRSSSAAERSDEAHIIYALQGNGCTLEPLDTDDYDGSFHVDVLF